jgi:hypothetical protein
VLGVGENGACIQWRIRDYTAGWIGVVLNDVGPPTSCVTLRRIYAAVVLL